MTEQMRFASATTTEADIDQASESLVRQIQARMKGAPLDLALVFLSPHFSRVAGYIRENLYAALEPRTLLGCTGEGVIGRKNELDGELGITLVAARMPQVTLTPFLLQSTNWRALLSNPFLFHRALSNPDDPKLFVMLADPFSIPMEELLNAFNAFYPGRPIIGGMASGSRVSGGNVLFFNDQVVTGGAVGVAFAGAVEVDVIVSQGCRPIGDPFTITAAQRNTILSLDGKPPLARIRDMVLGLSPLDRDLLRSGLFIGRAIDSERESLGRGDFLIRGVIGVDEGSGAIVIGDAVHVHETVQFHIRDATTAIEDLEMMLTPQLLYGPPLGAFLFSCNGRGTRLYNRPNGDITTIKKVIGEVDLAGFFCAGEIGPIGGKNFLHGHTASLALFRSLLPEEEEK
jgi:small ligand-binding sensory domain FIST